MNPYTQELKSKCNEACKKDGECIKYVQLFLDGMACKTKDAYFLNGICNCTPCSEYFAIHDCIKENLKLKLQESPLPENLVEKIRTCLHM